MIWFKKISKLLLLGVLALPALVVANKASPVPVNNAVQASIIDDLPAHNLEALQGAARVEVERGRYIARLGDCVACHTGDKSKPLAGGLVLKTPFGPLHSTNITPDAETGISRYTFEQFEKAMRKGVAADGHNLYPAMPYPSYAKISQDDMKALFAYLMKGVEPVKQENKPLELSFPFNQRWGLALWNWLFLDETPFQENKNQAPEWNRGAYIVQGLGHCGACHTPRGVAFQEKALTEAGGAGAYFLAGETVEHWRALSLRNLWTPEETAQMLKTGSNRHGSVSGNMVDVVQHSTQYMTDSDLLAIGIYLKSLPSGAHDKPMEVAKGAAAVVPAANDGLDIESRVPVDLYTSRGGLGYLQFCNDCHRSDGAGVSGVFPPLAENSTLRSEDPSSLIHIMLTGSRAPQTHARARPLTMPSLAQLSDAEIAEILNFTRQSWGQGVAKQITVSMVSGMRKELDGAKAAATTFETPRLANMFKEANAAQLTLGARLNIDTRAMLPKNVGNALNCASCHLNAGTLADGSPYVGVSAFFPSYAPRAGRVITLADRINGCFLRSMNGKPLPLESEELEAMVKYFDWMRNETKPGDEVAGRGVGKVSPQIVPNAENGKQIYAAQCAVCHGTDGEGIKNAKGKWVYPPLWGDDSFNIGAGMARTYTAAAFVKRNMPIGFHNGFPLGQGGMSDQEAVDVADYFSHQPRPDFAPKVKDWPKDRKPVDARY